MIKRPILIQGAMDVELENLKHKISDLEKKDIDGYEFYIGNLKKYPIVISKTEVGVINSTIATTIAIKTFHPCIIINQGSAGGYDSKANKGKLIVIQDCLNLNSYKTGKQTRQNGYDFNDWTFQTFYDGEDKFKIIESNYELLEFIRLNQEKITDESVIYGRVGSGDCWNQETNRIEYLNKKYYILAEDMETIGAYMVASKYNIPIVGIRVVTNNEMLQEEYERTLASKSQEFVISLCQEWIEKGKQK